MNVLTNNSNNLNGREDVERFLEAQPLRQWLEDRASDKLARPVY